MVVRRISNNELYHHGIEGQKWGVRRFQNEDGSLTPAGRNRYNKMAKKDAKEWARAKMYYGEGAGTRRKLIKARVDERSKNDYYKQQFDAYLNEQDMSKHASAAKAERKFNDAKNTTAKTARGVKNLAMRTGASVTLGAVVAYSGYKLVKNNPDLINKYKKKKINSVNTKHAEEWINSI